MGINLNKFDRFWKKFLKKNNDKIDKKNNVQNSINPTHVYFIYQDKIYCHCSLHLVKLLIISPLFIIYILNTLNLFLSRVNLHPYSLFVNFSKFLPTKTISSSICIHRRTYFGISFVFPFIFTGNKWETIPVSHLLLC